MSCRRQGIVTQGPAPDPKCNLNISSFLTLWHLLDCLICTRNYRNASIKRLPPIDAPLFRGFFNKRPPKNSKNLINALLAVDGTEDDLISCFKEGKKCAGGRALLQAQMENLNDGSLHENPFDIVDEDVIAAAPAFNVIEEDDVDDDLDI